MTDRIPDEIMREACVMAHRLMLPDEDVFNLAVDLVSRALMARDRRAAEIATEYRHSPALIPGVILSYDEAQQ